MSLTNVRESLDAVERALGHFASSLERGGFAEGVPAYRQMADVVIGQWLWLDGTDAYELEPRFLRVADLADSIAAHLSPYADTMQRLATLRGLVAERRGVDQSSTSVRIIEALASSGRPLSLTEIRGATGGASTTVRRELAHLVERRRVIRIGERRPRYSINGQR